jgi:hypothetical protein
MGRVCSMNLAERNAYTILVGKPQRKRRRYRWVDNMIMDLRAIRWGSVVWIHLTYRDQ